MTRDSQRSRVYKAERQAFARFTGHDKERFPDLSSCADYVRAVTARKRVQAAIPRARHFHANPHLWRLKDGRGTRHARGGGGRLNLPLWARNRPVILHEMAHCFAPAATQHGWEFCDIYLTLVLHALGREAHDELKAAFKANRVRYTKPRERRSLSPEQRVANIERLRRYRETKRAAATVTTEPEREQAWYEVEW